MLPPPKIENGMQATFSFVFVPLFEVGEETAERKVLAILAEYVQAPSAPSGLGAVQVNHGPVDCFPLSFITKVMCDRLQ